MSRSLLALVESSPAFMQHLNGGLTVLWIVMVPLSYVAGWLDSVVYVSALSLWALVSGHWAAWQAARVEVRQDEDADVQEVLARLDQLEQLLSSIDERLQASGASPRD
jgi:hypothetical protein